LPAAIRGVSIGRVDLRERLRLDCPVVQAPLDGGLATAELAAAVSSGLAACARRRGVTP
jgi:hypothetical protein